MSGELFYWKWTFGIEAVSMWSGSFWGIVDFLGDRWLRVDLAWIVARGIFADHSLAWGELGGFDWLVLEIVVWVRFVNRWLGEGLRLYLVGAGLFSVLGMVPRRHARISGKSWAHWIFTGAENESHETRQTYGRRESRGEP
jgi:hypothetical protein